MVLGYYFRSHYLAPSLTDRLTHLEESITASSYWLRGGTVVTVLPYEKTSTDYSTMGNVEPAINIASSTVYGQGRTIQEKLLARKKLVKKLQ